MGADQPRTDAVELSPPTVVVPTRYLNLWIGLLWLNVVLTPLGYFAEVGRGVNPVAFALGWTFSCIVAALSFGLGLGLYRRRLWAWKANWICLFGGWLLGPLVQSITPSAAEYFILLIMSGILFLLPSCIYFEKRRNLFS